MTLKLRLFAFCFTIFLLMGPLNSFGQIDSIQKKKKLSFKDSEDGAIDLSQFLLEANGVLPVVIPITEPAVGYGGGAALLYFHKRKKKYDSYVPQAFLVLWACIPKIRPGAQVPFTAISSERTGYEP